MRSLVPAGLSALAFLTTVLWVSACSEGDTIVRPTPAPPPTQPRPPNIPTQLPDDADLPGFEIVIRALGGASGPNGAFQVGDHISVNFTMQLGNGTGIPVDQVDFAGIMVSGPTTNYQRIIEYQRNLRAAVKAEEDGSYTYTFADAIPATYLPPINDTASFGPADGELAGQPLLSGTYTVGIEAYKSYTIGARSFRDAGNATRHFLIGDAETIDDRDVVGAANCAQCHDQLRAHGNIRRDLTLCMLCHTAGAEDKNIADVAGGTPGASIDWKVMIHKIHNGAHLPSVLGVATKDDGRRDYDAEPKKYQLVGFGNRVHDYSHVGFPIWPNLSMPLPRDTGHGKLGSREQGLENTIRSGAATCAKCHGDPAGAGPLAAPRQGDFAFRKPTRASCGSCHDDVDWSKDYISNQLRMPPQPDNETCAKCHPASGGTLGTAEMHLHPLNDPKRNPGLVVDLTAVREAGKNNGNGRLDPGEKLEVEFALKNHAGAPVDPKDIARMETVVNGPTHNRNMLLEVRWPLAALSGSTMKTTVPEKVFLELAGYSTDKLDRFTTARAPHWLNGADTTVWARNGKTAQPSDKLAAATRPFQNWVDLTSTAGFARGKWVVVDEGVSGKEEYLRIQLVDGKRLWFSSIHSSYDQPHLRVAHASNAVVKQVELAEKKAGTDYRLNAATGEIEELVEFGEDKAVVVSYTTDFVVPERYPTSHNDSPDLDESFGEWTGKKLVAGTYTVGIWGERTVRFDRVGETNTYVGAAKAATKDFLVGDAAKLQPGLQISSPQNCYACHDDIYFHGSHRRGYDSCLLCHGTAGGEDRPPYVAANATPTPGTSIDFRQMLHKIHMGKDLANASTYTVVGFGRGYPNNFSDHTYEHVGFPSMPGGTQNCASCHGKDNAAWKLPAPRNHPTEQKRDTRSWFVACSSCHDSSAATAHMEANTSPAGGEACAVCHGSGKDGNVELSHKRR